MADLFKFRLGQLGWISIGVDSVEFWHWSTQ